MQRTEESLTSRAIEVCSGLLGPAKIMHVDQNNGLIHIDEINGMRCYIEMKTASSGILRYFSDKELSENSAINFFPAPFNNLNELHHILRNLYSRL